MNAEDKSVYLIVGASGGIGSVVTDLLHEAGHTLVLAARDLPRLQSIGDRTNADTHQLDACDPDAVDSLISAIVEAHGRLDGMVNCAGSLLLKPAHLINPMEFAGIMATNLTTAFNLVHSGTRVMMRQDGGGSIVLCSSVAARRGLMNHEAIAAAKAGIEGLALAAAATYARYQVRINCVAPGLTRTPMTESMTSNPNMLKATSAMHPLGKIGEPADVASAIHWLLSDRQGWVTGQVLGIDGGLSRLQARG